MKNLLILAMCFFLLGVCQNPSVVMAQEGNANLDLSMRRAAYFNFKESGAIDLKGKFVAAGAAITLNKGMGNCNNDGCKFAIGFILFRNVVENEPAFKVNVVGEKTSTLVFGFSKGKKITEARHETPPLKMGANKVRIVLDADNKFAEINEDNNSFEITIVVVEDR
jgi:CARDB